ncbi:MAG: undecaprenyl-diphosphatase, partial [Candidatus Marinimicrobia bacterium]|nr:undecaprenyl-diphosphatase [Candidatus Neomarinimicrobiota bacterium]
MQIFDVIILGILQGLTEFLPVSSSGHLVLGKYLLNVKSPGNTLEILFHLGTLGSVIFVFYSDIINILMTIKKKSTQKLLTYIFIATIPATIVGFTLRNRIEILYESVSGVGFALLFTGLVLILSSVFKNENSEHSLLSSVVIGFGQALAIIPGISRSGMTIALSLFFGFSPKESAKFSFLLSIPIIAGAGMLGIQDIQSTESFSP